MSFHIERANDATGVTEVSPGNYPTRKAAWLDAIKNEAKFRADHLATDPSNGTPSGPAANDTFKTYTRAALNELELRYGVSSAAIGNTNSIYWRIVEN